MTACAFVMKKPHIIDRHPSAAADGSHDIIGLWFRNRSDNSRRNTVVSPQNEYRLVAAHHKHHRRAAGDPETQRTDYTSAAKHMVSDLLEAIARVLFVIIDMVGPAFGCSSTGWTDIFSKINSTMTSSTVLSLHAE